MLVSSLPFGGGRGYIAVHPLKPGTLVLVEKAIMTWSDEQIGQALTLTSVHLLFRQSNAAYIVHCLEDLHPCKAVVGSNIESETPEQGEEMLAMLLHERYKSDPLLLQLVEEARTFNIHNRDGSDLTANDILRILLALRYNGLESGLYCYVAMLNHHCRPNCVKFLPNAETESDLPANCSEVRTTRWIKVGESLTISYLPNLISHASRRHHLWEQHRFDIGVNMHPELRRMETIHGGLPSSSKDYVDEESTSRRIERSLAEMGQLYDTFENSLTTSAATVDMESWEQVKALEVTSLELAVEAEKQLRNHNHLLLIPCLVLHLNASELVLQTDAKILSLSHRQRCKLLGRIVATGTKLVELQKMFCGKDHFDVARTYLDLSQAIEELLSKSQMPLLSSLEATNQGGPLKSFRDWSLFEHSCRKEHERIKDFYPRDAMELIRTSVSTSDLSTQIDQSSKADLTSHPVTNNNSAAATSLAAHSEIELRVACYCEENVWRLAYRRLYARCQTPPTQSEYYVVFVSNPAKCVCFFHQKAASDPGKPVFWDYHVLLFEHPTSRGRHSKNGTLVWDVDSLLPYPCPLSTYLDHAFFTAEQDTDHDSEMAREVAKVQPLFRVVPAATFLKHFRSDRSHMWDDVQKKWSATPPTYDAIVDETGQGRSNNLMTYINMTENLSDEVFGSVLALKDLATRFIS